MSTIERRELQPYGAVRRAPIALAADARADSAHLLNGILADSMILHALYKKHHWLVAGPTFYQLHLLFDKHADEQLELIDLLAERIRSLGRDCCWRPAARGGVDLNRATAGRCGGRCGNDRATARRA